ncbi:MAG: hypothetical protein H7317_13975, partial [Pseudorhodobacter sp.]|nr:hypothetical protein [Pseudorhodobacter sp.]
MLNTLTRLSAIAALVLAAAPAWAETGKLGIEVNKFEEIEGGGCRAYF